MRVFNKKLTDKPALERIVDNASITGSSRKTSWWYNRAKAGYVYNLPEGAAVEFAKTLDTMITELKKHHKDNWDILAEPYSTASGIKFNPSIVIHYPCFYIENSEGLEHWIEDLYVCFGIRSYVTPSGTRNFHPRDPKGFRTSFTEEEKAAQYAHSHLISCGFTSPHSISADEFCLGDDTPIVNTLETLALSYSPEMFGMYLLNIDALVEWESLEGVPYKNIEDIREFEVSNEQTAYYFESYAEKERIYQNLLSKLRSIKLPVVFQGNKFLIRKNHFEKILHTLIKEDRNLAKRLLVKKDPSSYGRYICFQERVENISTGGNIEIGNETEYFYFRDKKIKLTKIVPETSITQREPESIDEYKVHKEILTYVTEKLEHTILKEEIRNCAIRKHNSSLHTRRRTS